MLDVRRAEGHVDQETAHQSAVGGPASGQPVPAGHQQPPEAREEGQEVAAEAQTPTPPEKRRSEQCTDQGSNREQCHRRHNRVQAQDQVRRNDIQLQLLRPRLPVRVQHGRAVKTALSLAYLRASVLLVLVSLT